MKKRAIRAASIALVAIAVGLVVPSRLLGQDVVCDAGDREVRGLDFQGNQALDDADLRVRVSTTPSDLRYRLLRFGTRRCLSATQLARDVIGLTRYYRDRGFYRVQVDTAVQSLGGNAIKVTFRIAEGEPTIVRSYTISGLEGLRDSAEIIRRLRLRVGGRWDLGLYQADQDSIVALLRNSGYFRASVIPSFDRTDSTLSAVASIQVLPGHQARFGESVVEVTTLPDRDQQIPNEIVRRVMNIRTGQLYSDRAVVDAQRNLFQLGTYRYLEVTTDSALTTDTLVILRVVLTEDYMRQLDGEFGYATLDCGRVRLQYTDRNILGTARRLELTGQATKIGYGMPWAVKPLTRDICTGLAQVFRSSDLEEDQFSEKLHYFTGATYRQPRLLGTRWVPTVSVYSERRGEFKAYLRSTQIGADVAATRDIADRTSLRLGYSIEYGSTDAQDAALCALFNRCDRESRRVITQLATLGVANATLARIRTDNIVSPTRGTAIRTEIRTSASELLGTDPELFFNKGTGDIAYYFPLTRRNIVALRLRGGVVLGRRLRLTDATGLIPQQERLYAGGPTSVRGFQQNELGKVVYIARNSQVDTLVIPPSGSQTDTTYQFFVSSNPDSVATPDRTVPLGGNSLLVVNAELRMRLPFLFPDILQITPFIDGGNVWTRAVGGRERLKWTPGLGVRALTFIGPIQINAGYNDYAREPGPIYFNPNVSTLACASPLANGNAITYRRDATGQMVQVDPSLECPSYAPATRNSFWQKLTFTFSIGSDF